MEENILLLLQLVRHLEASINYLETAYNNSDKERFNSYKKSVLDFQSKIDFVLNQNVV